MRESVSDRERETETEREREREGESAKPVNIEGGMKFYTSAGSITKTRPAKLCVYQTL